MKAILRSINNFSCKLKQNNNLKYDISPKIRSNKFKSISGNGNVVIDDAIKKQLKNYKIYGNTYQNSTIGKNLYGISDYSNTVNGVEITIKDGVITLNGTCSSNTTLVIDPKEEQNLEGNYNMSLNLLNGTYTGTANVNLRNANDNSVIGGTQLNCNALNKGFTLPTKNIKYGIYFTKNTIFDNLKFRPQLVVGTEPDYDYESYTGGQPSPNPDYPQEIISCGDRTKNLCFTNIDNWESGQYATNGEKSYSPGRIRLKELLKIETGKQYYFNTFSEFKLILRTYDENKNFISSYGVIENGNTLTLQTAKYLGITIYNPNDSSLTYSDYEALFENETIKPFICFNSEPDKSYESYYDGYKIPINVRSENLFDKNDLNNLLNNVSINGTTSVISNANGFYTLKMECKPNTTYIISKVISTRFIVAYSNNLAYTSGEVLLGKKSNNSATNLIITTGGNAKTLYVFYSKLSDETTYTLQEILDSIQILEGTTGPNKYIPYYNETTNIYLDEPLRKIGKYSDYIDFINGKVVKNIEEVVLDGSESWSTATASGENRFVCNAYDNALIPINLNTIGNILSDKFIPRTANETANAITGIAIAGSGKIVIYYNLTKDYTTEQFKTWLSSHNVIVDYALSTPTEESIELSNINLIEGKNIITIGTKLTGVIEIEYYSNEIIDISDYKYNLRKVEE